MACVGGGENESSDALSLQARNNKRNSSGNCDTASTALIKPTPSPRTSSSSSSNTIVNDKRKDSDKDTEDMNMYGIEDDEEKENEEEEVYQNFAVINSHYKKNLNLKIVDNNTPNVVDAVIDTSPRLVENGDKNIDATSSVVDSSNSGSDAAVTVVSVPVNSVGGGASTRKPQLNTFASTSVMTGSPRQKSPTSTTSSTTSTITLSTTPSSHIDVTRRGSNTSDGSDVGKMTSSFNSFMPLPSSKNSKFDITVYSSFPSANFYFRVSIVYYRFWTMVNTLVHLTAESL